MRFVSDAVLGSVTEQVMAGGETVFEVERLGADATAHVQRLLEVLALPWYGHLVDVGCGVGTVSTQTKAIRPDVRCTNLNLSVEQARWCDAVIVGDGQAMPLKTSCADGVLFAYVMGYGSAESFLREAARITRNGGRLCIYDLYSERPDQFFQETGYQSYRPEEVCRSAHRSGWSMTSWEPTPRYRSRYFVEQMGSDDFERVFGACHHRLYRGIRHA